MISASATLTDFLHELGDIPTDRIRMNPPPGTATVQDVIDIEARENRLFELVEGTLTEKGMGSYESMVGMAFGDYLRAFLRGKKLGVVLGADGMIELPQGFVRIPDVAFISRARLPNGKPSREAIWRVVPDLTVEVLSASNTRAEMLRKRREYFDAGVRAVWEVDPVARTVVVYSAAESGREYHEQDMLDGTPVLPGFTLELKAFFAELDE